MQIAELQTAYLAIDECLKITNRRVNALEFIVVPRIDYVVKYIFTELEERSKEDKFKIKKILQVKKTFQENEELEKALKEKNNNSDYNPSNFEPVSEDEDDDEDDIREDERLFN